MHPYLPHLLADIAAATRPQEVQDAEMREALAALSNRTLDDTLEEAEHWVMHGSDGQPTLSQHTGLHREDFPPPDQLSDEDLRAVNAAFERMLFSYNLSADFPKTVPPAFAYELLVETLDEPTIVPKLGSAGFDYCTGYAPDCRLGEYCPCWDVWRDADTDTAEASPSNPAEPLS